MTATQGELAELSRYIFRTPSWHSTVAFAIGLAALAGIAAFDSMYLLEDVWLGIFFIGIPTLVAAIATTPIDRYLGGQLTFNRSSLLATVSEFVVVVVMSVAGLVAAVTPLGQNFIYDVLIGVLAFIFAIRFLVVHAVSRTHPFASAVPASIQTVVAGVFLFVYSGTMNYYAIGGPYLNALLSRSEQAPAVITYAFVPMDFTLLVGVSMLYAAGAYTFLRVVDRPWRRSLGVSSLDFLRGFIGHIAEGTRELEDFFEQIGEEAVVPVSVLSFRRADGSEKARWVLAMIHPGPMGDIGGGNLPRRVAESTDGLAFPPHGTAGHDFNLVTEREVETILEAADSALARIEYGELATQSVSTSVGDASVVAQGFGDDALVIASFSPTFADDVDYGVGLTAAAEARGEGVDEVMLVDAHNCNNGLEGDDLGHVVPGSERSFDLIEAVREASADVSRTEAYPFRLGAAWDRTKWQPEDGIGPLGVRVSVVEVAGQRTAYVLIDGNNMEPGLRDRIVEAIDGPDRIELMTTDTHIVNTIRSTNQVGESIDEAELIAVIERLFENAVRDLEPVTAGMATEDAEVTVFGNDRTETLASQANAVISMAGAFAAAVILATVSFSLIIFAIT
ncbi:MAG: DUF2070 family protein [archaeon]